MSVDLTRAEESIAEKATGPKPGHPADLDAKTRREVKDVARLAYLEVYDGWSTDEVLLQTKLNDQFLADVEVARLVAEDVDARLLWNFVWLLLGICRRHRDDFFLPVSHSQHQLGLQAAGFS